MQDEGLREALERLRTELGRGEIQDAGLRERVGALIGSRDNVDLDAFDRFGFFLGAAFRS